MRRGHIICFRTCTRLVHSYCSSKTVPDPVLCRPEIKGERVVQEHVFYRYFLSVSGAPNPAGVFGAPRKIYKRYTDEIFIHCSQRSKVLL